MKYIAMVPLALLMLLPARPTASASLAPELERRLAMNEEVPVIVHFSDRLDVARISSTRDARSARPLLVRSLKTHAERTQRSARLLAKAHGARDVRVLWAINALALRARPEAIRALAASPGVASVEIDQPLYVPSVRYAPRAATGWNADMIGVPVLQANGVAGRGVAVAILDTGVDVAHPELAAHWRGGSNSWWDPHGEHALPYDANGHGTQVMGLLNAESLGIAPEAQWVAVKIYNDAGASSVSIIHQGLQWLLDPDGNPATDDAPDVINSSWAIVGDNVCSTVFEPDIAVLRAAGILFAFAGGNSGPNAGTSISPANNVGEFSVGSVNSLREISSFSSRGPSACDGTVYPRVVAPGEAVTTTDLSFGGNPYYATVSGTSFAAPQAAGVFALLRGAFPRASSGEIESAVVSTAADLGTAGADNDYGYGLLSAIAAHDLLRARYPLVDLDQDGATADIDCDDQNPSVFPGAAEVRRDGIDQDCNGYDLTIEVTRAHYKARRGTIMIEAITSLNEAAALDAVGFGQLSWRPDIGRWSGEFKHVPADPHTVAVRGIEGTVTVTTTTR